MQDVLTLILGGGHGSGLYPLTRDRSEPAVPIAGKYRLIDIPISNCFNSGLKRIYVLTQFLSASLHTHIGSTYNIDPFSHGFVDVLAAQQTYEDSDWYAGTADAIRQHLTYVEHDQANLILVLMADQLYHFNFRELIRTHRKSGAELTIAVNPVSRRQASRYGIVRLNPQGEVIEMVEKPTSDEELDRLESFPGQERAHVANMGIYLFNRRFLLDAFAANSDMNDLVFDLFLPHLKDQPIQSHVFEGYWMDVGTVRAYHEASLSLVKEGSPFNFHTPNSIIYTRARNLPAARVLDSVGNDCLIADGAVIEQQVKLDRCIVGIRSIVGRNVQIRDSVIIGADFFEGESDRKNNREKGIPDVGIGEGTIIENAIVDKDCRIGKNVKIVNEKKLTEVEEETHFIRDGIVIIPKGVVIPDGTVI